MPLTGALRARQYNTLYILYRNTGNILLKFFFIRAELADNIFYIFRRNIRNTISRFLFIRAESADGGVSNIYFQF